MSFYGIKKNSAWFDQHGLFSLSLFLLIFIPLYPKLPLFEAIPGYLVRVRVEDLLVLITGLVWFTGILRQKIEWRTSFHFAVIGYALAGLISLGVAVSLQQTIPFELIHVGKSALHYFRYLEYFSLFLFMYAGVKTKRHAQIALVALVLALNLIFIYGAGQRYVSWPAFSTMNREYSKGQSLILNPADKLQSTFGGHYDLAAWLVIAIPLIASWILTSPSLLLRLWMGASVLSGGWLLWESGSKTALAACLLALTIPVWYWLKTKYGQVKSSLVIGGGALALAVVAFSGLWFWQRPTLYKLAPFLRPAGFETPIDATAIRGDETWSENAQKYGLSMGIRLDTLWPQALDGFSINPFTGKGYATLNKRGNTEFTEADGTDNNFLRVLGETGLLGFVTFFSLAALIIKTLLLKFPKDGLNQTLTVGFIAATLGLLVNAFIIDVFSASKVAFTYWAIAGLTLKSYSLMNEKAVKQLEVVRVKRLLSWWKKFWPVLIAGIFLIFLVHKRPFTEYSLVKSFALNTSQARYMAVTKCWSETKQLSGCTQQYQAGLGSAYSLYLLPFYLLYKEPAMFYFANLILMIVTAVLFDSLIKKFTSDPTFRFLLLTIIFTTPSIYALPTKSSPANLWLFLSLVLLNKLFSKIKQRRVSGLLKLFLLATTLVHLGLVQYFMSMTGSILASFRDTYRPSSYVAIRRANRYLSSRVSQSEVEPILLTTIEPVLFDIYGQNGYQTQPIVAENLKAHQELITQNLQQELFITNANVELSPPINQAFEEYKRQFGIKLRDIDCRHKCNYYQLLTEEVQIPTQAQTWNKQPLPQDSSNLKILALDDQLVADLGSGEYPTPEQQLLKQQLLEKQADLIFLIGDVENEHLNNYGRLFLQRLQADLKIPLVAVPNGYNPKKNSFPGPQYQRFSIGESWFITLDAAAHHTSPGQNLFLYDTLLQLEKHPEVKKVYFISKDNQWLQQHPDNYYFVEDFPKALEKFKNVEFEFIYPQDL
jgi:hypothetical protein